MRFWFIFFALLWQVKFLSASTIYNPSEDCTIQIKAEIKQPSCLGSKDGAIRLNVLQVTGSLNIHWNTGSRELELFAVPEGDYHVVIIDEKGCRSEKSFSLKNQFTFNPEIIIMEPSVQKPNGSVSIKSSDSKIVKTFLSNFSELSNIRKQEFVGAEIYNLASGNYMLDVLDNRGCIYTQSILLNNK